MSIPYTNDESPYEQAKANRSKINIALWDSDLNSNRNAVYCASCCYSGLGRLVPTEDKTKLQCRNCGRIEDIATEVRKGTTKGLKPKDTTITKGPMIISQNRKGKKISKFENVNDSLDEDTPAELRSYGYRI
jgi:hypothetical protein